MMHIPPRSAKGTWLLAAVTWIGLCAAAWEVLPPQPRVTLNHQGASPWMFSPDGRILVTQKSTADGLELGAAFWNVKTGQPLSSLPILPAGHSVRSFSFDGRWVRVYHQPNRDVQGTDQSWDLTAGLQVTHWTKPNWVIFSPTEPLVAVGTDTGDHPNIQLLDLPSLTLRTELPDASCPFFSPDGRLIAAPGPGQAQVSVWSVKTGRRVVTVPARVGGFGSVEIMPDNRTLVASVDLNSQVGLSAHDRETTVWNLPDGMVHFRIRGESFVRISPDGRLITVNGNPKLSAYDLQTGEPVDGDSPYVKFRLSGINTTTGGGFMARQTDELSPFGRLRQWLNSRGLPIARPMADRYVELAEETSARLIARLPNRELPQLSPTGKTLAVEMLTAFPNFGTSRHGSRSAGSPSPPSFSPCRSPGSPGAEFAG